MTTTRIREKISALVSSQLPEFIQSYFPTFVSFIEAYYKFLEQDQGALELVQNARSYNDIDSTTEEFVKYFLKNYAANFPENTLVNKRFLVKRINDIYTAKGSSLSFDVLFRTVFNTSVEIKTPFDFVLRVSDGRWDQRVSLRLKTVSGNRNALLNRFLPYQIGGIDYSTPIVNVKNLTSTLTEVFLDRNFLAPSYNVGDVIKIFDGSGNVIYTGTIEPTTTSYRVLRPGSGFKVGQIFNVGLGNAVGTVIKITKVSITGGIEEFKFLVYGYGFDPLLSSLQLDFDPTKNVSEVSDTFSTSIGVSNLLNLQLIDPTTQDYFSENYVTTGYTGSLSSTTTVLSTASPSSTTIGVKPANIATITFFLNALGRYPGQFTRENGFLSEPDVRLQDEQLYQAFAYQTNTELDRSEFFDVVKKLVHPAGQNLFNNRIIQGNVDLAGNVVLAFVSNVFFEATDSFAVRDSIQIDVNKFSDSAGVFDSKLNYLISKVLDDNFEALENIFLETTLNVFDNTQTSDDDSLSIEPNYTDQFNNDDSNILFNIDLVFSDFVLMQDKPIVFPSLTSPASILENIFFETILNVFDNTQTSDQDFLSIEPAYVDQFNTSDEDISFNIELNLNDFVLIQDKPIVFPSLTSPASIVENASLYLENNGIPNDSVSFNDPFTVGYFVTREFTEQRSNDYFLEFYAEDYAQVTGLVMKDFTTVSVQPLLLDAAAVSENISIDIQLSLVNGVSESEVLTSSLIANLIFYPTYTDLQSLQDNISIQLITTINNQVSLSEEIEGLSLNYASPEYFSQAYAGELVFQQP